MAEDKVLDQAERVAISQIERLRHQHEFAWGEALGRVGLSSGTIFVLADVCDTFLTQYTLVLVEALIDAHKTKSNRRNAKWSETTFAMWGANILSDEAQRMRAKWSDSSGTEWADRRQAFLGRLDPIVSREMTRLDALVKQHFRTGAKNWLQAQVERLKIVPVDVWKWLFGGGAFGVVVSAAKYFGLF